jgi:hypothetical protein
MNSNRKQKSWRRSLRDRLRPYQFNWIGRTKDGVSRWIGAPKGPTERICKFMTVYGIVMSIACLCAIGAIAIAPQIRPNLQWLALISGIHGLIFSVLGICLLKVKKNLANLKTTGELAEEFGSTPEAVERLVEAHGIRARININDDNLFDPEEFIASRSLLRAASAPYTSATLLRAAEPTSMHSGSETLLRPVEPDTVALTPIQQLFYSDDEETVEPEEVVQILRRTPI